MISFKQSFLHYPKSNLVRISIFQTKHNLKPLMFSLTPLMENEKPNSQIKQKQKGRIKGERSETSLLDSLALSSCTVHTSFVWQPITCPSSAAISTISQNLRSPFFSFLPFLFVKRESCACTYVNEEEILTALPLHIYGYYEMESSWTGGSLTAHHSLMHLLHSRHTIPNYSSTFNNF